ncbi:hypothetical protein [Bradyrhizobium japonicum]|uniref:hypothetical protein n=1 Tax=Bradyrhizobium japonicum TaxID=375 RepID=UPI0012BD2E75|nr:hypothetical protein [Bradyrhizobium japonicum]
MPYFESSSTSGAAADRCASVFPPIFQATQLLDADSPRRTARISMDFYLGVRREIRCRHAILAERSFALPAWAVGKNCRALLLA